MLLFITGRTPKVNIVLPLSSACEIRAIRDGVVLALHTTADVEGGTVDLTKGQKRKTLV